MYHTILSNRFKKTIVCCFVISLYSSTFAQDLLTPKHRIIKHRIGVSYLQSFYKNDPNLTIKTKTKPGVNISYKAEFISSKKLNFTIGLDFNHQHLKFNGYYALPGYTYIFDKTFPYSHDIQIREILLPIGFKETFLVEHTHKYTPYVAGGVGFRYLLNTYTVIRNDSTGLTVFDGKKTSVDYESKLPTSTINSYFYLGMGYQYNHRNLTGRANYFELTYKYGLSRYNYHGYNNSNNLGIRNYYLALTLGFIL